VTSSPTACTGRRRREETQPCCLEAEGSVGLVARRDGQVARSTRGEEGRVSGLRHLRRAWVGDDVRSLSLVVWRRKGASGW
jgi:hypothetical protein